MMKSLLTAAGLTLAVALSSVPAFAETITGHAHSDYRGNGPHWNHETNAWDRYGPRFIFYDNLLNNTKPCPNPSCATTEEAMAFGELFGDGNGYYTLWTYVTPTRTSLLTYGEYVLSFDLDNSFVYYGGNLTIRGSDFGDESESLAQILARGTATFDGVGNLNFSWFSDREVTGLTLAYTLTPVPEPETWAMLMAGLGIVGMSARRRRAYMKK